MKNKICAYCGKESKFPDYGVSQYFCGKDCLDNHCKEGGSKYESENKRD